MLITVLIGFGLAPFAALLPRYLGKAAGWVIALLPLGLFLYFLSLIPQLHTGESLVFTYSWVSSLGIDLTFNVDGLSVLFALVISGIGTAIMVYTGGYLAGHAQLGRFYLYLLMFMASMLGVVLAGNLITLFVFWELTGICSYLLIGFNHREDASRAAALTALLVTGIGGLALMAGLILLGVVAGGYDFASVLTQGEIVREHSLYMPILVLILAGAFTKSAQMPFHFWLPGAMAAPTPASAYLHSATMVKAGVYLLARFSPVLGETEAWMNILVGFGAVTLLMGGWLALQQTDLKRILAYSTVSTLGALVMLIGIGTEVAITAMLTLLVAHSLYKGALFQIAGVIDHETGTRDVTRLGGLARVMLPTAVASGLAVLSMVGIPPLFGFIAKELFYEGTLFYHLPNEGSGLAVLLTAVAVLANVFLVAAAAIAGLRPFIGQRVETPHTPHGAPLSLWLGPAVLGVVAVLLGVVPSLIDESLISPAASAVYGESLEIHLALWHGINPMLVLSVVTVIGGVVVYLSYARILQSTAAFSAATSRIAPTNLYHRGFYGVLALAGIVTRIFQSGYLRAYLRFILVTVIVLVGYALLRFGEFDQLLRVPDVQLHELAVALTILVAGFLAITAPSLLGAVFAMGVVGYGVALIYTLFGAPDLAMTQFAIETLTVFLFVLVLYRLPEYTNRSRKSSMIRDAIISAAVGIIITALVLIVTAEPLRSHVSAFYAANSLPEAHGRNIVNVILVDFRGLDTMGEITVLAVASLGIYALLKLRPKPEEDDDGEIESADTSAAVESNDVGPMEIRE